MDRFLRILLTAGGAYFGPWAGRGALAEEPFSPYDKGGNLYGPPASSQYRPHSPPGTTSPWPPGPGPSTGRQDRPRTTPLEKEPADPTVPGAAATPGAATTPGAAETPSTTP